jgi:hypothetical protein
VVATPRGLPTGETEVITVDDVRVSATESPEEPCSCFEGYVFLGSVVESTQDLDGEVVEYRRTPCRRCNA